MAVITVADQSGVVSEIVIERGVTRPECVRARVVPTDETSQRIAVFGQPGSAPLARDLAATVEAELRILPDRDAAKTLAVVEECYLWLNHLHFARGDLVIAVGGGALTDVVGFVAATYLRGVPLVLIPTTLLGAVDAAIGGKTGVNVEGKNLAGVFRHPERVLVDPAVIEATPLALRREGAAEAVKAGLIGDPDLVEMYRRHGLAAPIEQVLERAVRVKAGIVSTDFREAGVRAHLNYGHTIGHAVEVACGISHGEAVSIGMVAAAAVAERKLGFTGSAAHRSLLEALGLPVVSPYVDVAEVRRLVRLDKKRDDTGLRMTLLQDVAKPVVVPVDDDDVTVALRAIGLS